MQILVAPLYYREWPAYRVTKIDGVSFFNSAIVHYTAKSI